MTDWQYWAVVPAAGVGRRMQSDIPKQYLPLAKSTVLDTTLSKLTGHPLIAGVVVALSPEDGYWPDSTFYHHPQVKTVEGGAERSDSVFRALSWLAKEKPDDTRVLVHDAARPCIRTEDIDQLITQVGDNENGGLLGIKVKDTMKQTDDAGLIQSTVDRDKLWHAYTPQMFPLGSLLQALTQVKQKALSITDDASAMELMGYHPVMVEGRADNIKITRPEDLALAEFYLQN